MGSSGEAEKKGEFYLFFILSALGAGLSSVRDATSNSSGSTEAAILAALLTGVIYILPGEIFPKVRPGIFVLLVTGFAYLFYRNSPLPWQKPETKVTTSRALGLESNSLPRSEAPTLVTVPPNSKPLILSQAQPRKDHPDIGLPITAPRKEPVRKDELSIDQTPDQLRDKRMQYDMVRRLKRDHNLNVDPDSMSWSKLQDMAMRYDMVRRLKRDHNLNVDPDSMSWSELQDMAMRYDQAKRSNK
jgi:hypothetical protein